MNFFFQIVDVNDNSPQFSNTPSSFEISENAEIGTDIFKVTTLDPDTGISGISRFSVEVIIFCCLNIPKNFIF